MKIEINGVLANKITSKDIILKIISKIGTSAGTGHVIEFTGSTVKKMTMEERMTICNMSIEGGARCGYVNPDEKTYDYLKERLFAPKKNNWDEAIKWWDSIKSDEEAVYDDVITIDASKIEPTITWGITPGQSIGINQTIPSKNEIHPDDQFIAEEAYEYMGFHPGQLIKDTPIDVCFIGSCTNGRISDLRAAAKIVKHNKVAKNVKAFVVPGSEKVAVEAQKEGLDKIFLNAGFQWRQPGCSMCLAMNSDKLKGNQISASSSNRNFKGRQGSPNGRTLLMSPAMVAAAAIAGKISDVRDFIEK